MAGKASSLGKHKKKGETPSKTDASRAKRRKDPKTRGAGEAEPMPDEKDKPGLAIQAPGLAIQGEIPEALAYFLEVYGRLRRG